MAFMFLSAATLSLAGFVVIFGFLMHQGFAIRLMFSYLIAAAVFLFICANGDMPFPWSWQEGYTYWLQYVASVFVIVAIVIAIVVLLGSLFIRQEFD
jgi:hypothetical protein